MDATKRWMNRFLPWDLRCACFLAVVPLILASCVEETADQIQAPDTSDTIAPRAVNDLQLNSRTEESISMSWTAPGDDGDRGRAFRYDVRQDTDPISPESWDHASQISGEPPPFVSGRLQVFTINETSAEKTFYFALRSYDVTGNVSLLSNVIEVPAVISADAIGPEQVDDLHVTAVQSRSVELRWTAPGDDGDVGTAAGYILRYHRIPLDSNNFEKGTLLPETPVPTEAGTEQVGLSNN